MFTGGDTLRLVVVVHVSKRGLTNGSIMLSVISASQRLAKFANEQEVLGSHLELIGSTAISASIVESYD